MIHGLKPYPVMKGSGVSWLWEVPEHWDVLPALDAHKPKLVKNIGMIEKTVLSLNYQPHLSKMHAEVAFCFAGE